MGIFDQASDRQGAWDDLPMAKRPGCTAAMARAGIGDNNTHKHHDECADGGDDGKYTHEKITVHAFILLLFQGLLIGVVDFIEYTEKIIAKYHACVKVLCLAC